MDFDQESLFLRRVAAREVPACPVCHREHSDESPVVNGLFLEKIVPLFDSESDLEEMEKILQEEFELFLGSVEVDVRFGRPLRAVLHLPLCGYICLCKCGH